MEKSFSFLHNLSPFKAKTNLPGVIMGQVHSARILQINNENLKQRMFVSGCDGMCLVGRIKISMGIRVADCMGVFAYHKGNLVGAFHAGWRGIAQGIGSCFVSKISTVEGIEPEELEFEVSPHICRSCYQVGKEVGEKFPPEAVNKGKLDLFEALRIQVLRSGVEADKITRAQKTFSCTYEKRCYFSHRRGDRQRMLMFAMQY